MSRPNSPGLFDVPAPAPRRRGRHERATDRSISAARDADLLGVEHEGAVAVLRALARSLDAAELADAPAAVVPIAREFRQALDACGLLPTPTSTPVDPFDALLGALDADADAV